jgi:hypothetical protein
MLSGCQVDGCVRPRPGWSWRECLAIVVVLVGGQAAAKAAEQPVEEVALSGVVPVAGISSAVAVGADAG